MVKKICPVCELPVNEVNYCTRCRRLVRRPVMWEVDYYLNERHTAFEKSVQPKPVQQKSVPTGPGKPGYHEMSRPVMPSVHRQPQPFAPREERGRKGFYAAMAGILVAIVFTNLMPKVFNQVGRILNEHDSYETAVPYDDSGYAEFEEEEVRAAGEHCTGYDHFPADGKQIADSMWQFLSESDYGYQVELGDAYSDNYEFQEEEGPITYYETIASFTLEDEITGQLEPDDENYIFQYVDINYDTATGELHDYVSTLKDPEASLAYLEQFLKLTEASAGISPEESSVPNIMEQARAGITQENGAFILEGLFYINFYQVEEEMRIYVTYNNPQETENQET